MCSFRGVDYSSSPLEVKPYRATDMANLILKDGVLHKRNGWEQIKNVFLSDGEEILGVYVLNDIIIVHAKFGIPGYMEGIFYIIDSNFNIVKNFIFPKAIKSGSSVVVDGKLYISCGEYLVFDGKSLLSLSNTKDAFIPTTTINIPKEEYPIEYIETETGETITTLGYAVTDTSVEDPNLSKDHINLLTAWRKNILKGKAMSESAGGSFYFYWLDGRISVDSNFFDCPTIEMQNGIRELTINDFKQTFRSSLDPSGKFGSSGFVWYSDSTGIEIGQYEYYQQLYKNIKQSIVYIPSGFNAFPIEGAEITVTYKEHFSINNASIIESCNISTIFGINGANDRIFLSGSDTKKNIVFYSENNEGFNPEPTYFPANYQIACGATNSTITSFMRVSDGTLAVFKDVTNIEDVCVYYIGGFLQSIGVGKEGNESHQAVFNVTSGGIKQKGASAKNVSLLDGDPIFVSSEGVFGIQLSSNVSSGERYAKERSRVINSKLTQFDITNSRGISYNGKYYLSVGGEYDEVYVADARYKYTQNGDADDGFNYEWFRWTNVPAAEWFEYNNQLYFISKDGYICRMTDGYADIYIASTENNRITVCEKSDGSGCYVAFDESLLPIIQKASYALDQNGNYWTIENLADTHTVDGIIDSFDVPSDIAINAGEDLTLRFHLPINAHWKSAIIDLGNSMYRKNLWSLSTTVIPTECGFVKVGYKTRYNEQMKDRANKQVEGAYVFSFDDVDFSMFNFDCGGFVNAFRQKVFERGFIYIQLAFASDSIGDCIVTEMDLEYSPTIKNMGVG